ncbi:hypothetical protein PO902_05725 [Planococcus maritimus]|nr:hypothetical protein [Planococcus sp. SK3692]MDE4084545.1 hypothetical protein [Planococcus maritimus]
MINIREMKYKNMLKMTEHLRQNDYYTAEEKLVFSFSDLKFIEPAGALIFLSTINKLRESKIPYEFESIDNVLHKSAISYGERMGIFQKLGLSNEPIYREGSTYIAPLEININQLFKELKMQETTIEEYYDTISEKIVNKILMEFENYADENIKDLFLFVIREMVRNVFDHSKASRFLYGAQMYSAHGYVEVVLADLGIGLKETIPFDEEEVWYGKDTDEAAIRKSVLPGLSAWSNHSYAPEDYKNSGYGLALVKKIIEGTEGILCIASGTKSIEFSRNQEVVRDCDIKGTVIRMKICPEKLSQVDFSLILADAEKEATEKGFSNVPSTASKRLKSKVVKKN